MSHSIWLEQSSCVSHMHQNSFLYIYRRRLAKWRHIRKWAAWKYLGGTVRTNHMQKYQLQSCRAVFSFFHLVNKQNESIAKCVLRDKYCESARAALHNQHVIPPWIFFSLVSLYFYYFFFSFIFVVDGMLPDRFCFCIRRMFALCLFHVICRYSVRWDRQMSCSWRYIQRQKIDGTKCKLCGTHTVHTHTYTNRRQFHRLRHIHRISELNIFIAQNDRLGPANCI